MTLPRREFLRSAAFAATGWRALAQTAQFRGEAPQVLIPFTAVDRRHRLVESLQLDQFRLIDEGEARHIQFVSLDEGPASVLFVLDVSGSMKAAAEELRQAMQRMVAIAAIDDEFGLIEFDDRPRVTAGFTIVPEAIRERVRAIAPAGSTSMIDAMMVALRGVRDGHQQRKAIVVLSDGQDNHSRHVESEVMQMAAETDARIYAIELYPPMGDSFTQATFLERLAEETGGRYFPTVDRSRIPELIERIDLHRSYLLGFTPPPEHRDGSFHRVELRVERAGGVRLFWKRRYRVPSA